MKCNSTTIYSVLSKINSEYFLPDIQRKFVWKENQTYSLFDSIMRGYPIGTFLFWKVNIESLNREESVAAYKFLEKYSADDNANEILLTPIDRDESNNEKILVLDGQQRLTALYIALYGTYSKKKGNHTVETELYFNISSGRSGQLEEGNIVDDNGIDDDTAENNIYEFAYLTSDEKDEQNEKGEKYWYRVKDLRNFNMHDWTVPRFNTYCVRDLQLNDDQATNLGDLRTKLLSDEIISAFEIPQEAKLDEILNIFVRVNRQGVKLTKGDFLFSVIVSHWSECRKKTDALIKGLKHRGYEFKIDDVMKACLYLTDKDPALQVQCFKKTVVEKIRKNWVRIEGAFYDMVELLKAIGFENNKNLTSTNAIMPILYYCYHNAGKRLTENIKENLRKYLVAVQINKVFGKETLPTLKKLRDKIKDNKYCIDYDKLCKEIFSGGKTLKFDRTTFEECIDRENYGSPYVSMLLRLLYPDFKYDQKKFDEDHLYPKAFFKTDKKLRSLGIPADKISEYIAKVNKLPNLQILESMENQQIKRKTSLQEWVKDSSNMKAVMDYCDKKKAKNNDYFALSNFLEFYEDRKKNMLEAIESVFKREEEKPKRRGRKPKQIR